LNSIAVERYIIQYLKNDIQIQKKPGNPNPNPKNQSHQDPEKTEPVAAKMLIEAEIQIQKNLKSKILTERTINPGPMALCIQKSKNA
jgi:hypothetical protein